MGSRGEPAYLRVLEDLRTRISTGLLEPGARVPSRNAIITSYGVGETAAKHVLAALAAEGLIQTRPGSGSYVRKIPPAVYLEHDRPHFPGSPFGVRESAGAEAARRLTWEHQTEVQPPPAQIARRLGLAHGRLATVTRYLLRADGDPVQLAVSYEPADLTAGTAVAVPEEGAYAGRGVIERMRAIGVDIDQVTEEVCVRAALRAEVSALGLARGAAVLVIDRAHHSQDTVVEVARIVIAADRYRLRYRFPATARWSEGSPERPEGASGPLEGSAQPPSRLGEPGPPAGAPAAVPSPRAPSPAAPAQASPP